ncbi:MAG: hypothetical protein JWN46_2209 [Acidimicrobiales bacterium]|nr:hypothetical protein [Acidimicrobiales bacterium]
MPDLAREREHVTTTPPTGRTTPTASGAAGRAGLLAIGAFVVLLAAFGTTRGFLATGDSQSLVSGAKAGLHCLRHGPWRACGLEAGTRGSTVGSYPLLQYLPAGVLRGLGVSAVDTVRALGWLSLASFVVLLGLLARSARRFGAGWWPAVLAVAVSGPLLFYATSAFGEMLAATVVVGAVVAARERRPLLLFVMAALACLAKETLPPFILALGILAARDHDEDGLLPPARLLVPLSVGVVAGAAASAAFNVFRYGTVRNITYLAADRNVTAPRQVATNTISLLAAPGGGLAPFWPSMVLLAGLFTAATIAALRHRRDQTALAHVAVLLTAGAFTVALATWWSPFGWVAWGPRLLLPLAPALVLVAVHTGGRRLSRLLRTVLRPPLAFAAVTAVCVIGSFPQASGPWVATRAAQSIIVRSPACTQRWPPDDPRYWTCFDQRAWRLHDTPLRTATEAGGGLVWLARVLLLGGVACLLVEARRQSQLGPDG